MGVGRGRIKEVYQEELALASNVLIVDFNTRYDTEISYFRGVKIL